ncbi:hypothetical protein Tco_0873711 [Tanacetum coccineum]|uniref:Uncharacterized protein n=1 Tax=Tanacetum coccineum TaxID=301880 RepID=A0ABQ5BJN3_9ASTR
MSQPANDDFSQHLSDDEASYHEDASDNEHLEDIMEIGRCKKKKKYGKSKGLRLFGGNANSKKMQKAVLKQQFEAFTISSSEGLEKGYDRFQQLLSQLEKALSQCKSSTNKVKSGHTGAYSTYTPSTSSNNIPEREVPAGFLLNEIAMMLSSNEEVLQEELECPSNGTNDGKKEGHFLSNQKRRTFGRKSRIRTVADYDDV